MFWKEEVRVAEPAGAAKLGVAGAGGGERTCRVGGRGRWEDHVSVVRRGLEGTGNYRAGYPAAGRIVQCDVQAADRGTASRIPPEDQIRAGGPGKEHIRVGRELVSEVVQRDRDLGNRARQIG